jgi:signal transduction histidine kinase
MKQLLKLAIAILFTFAAVTGTAYAQEHGTAAEAKQMVQNALAHIKDVGPNKAWDDFNLPTGKWHNKDIYVFCYTFEGTCLCNGNNKALVGKNLIDMKYPDGQLHIKKMAEIASSKGSGWDEYPWPHPVTKKIEHKQAFIAKVPGANVFVAAGIYK